MRTDLLIIGGGPAGLAAAISAHNEGIEDILIIERDNVLGGILNQCIHNGFGLHRFGEELTGPEYAQRDIDEIHRLNISYKLNTTILNIADQLVADQLNVTTVNSYDGILHIKPKAIILAMGCRERPRGAINIQGTRPAGVLTAGTAQKYVNLDGYLPGREVVILGSGDIGLIMARRMTWEGAKVKAVVELLPYSSGLRRNIVQCVEDFDIPLYYSHTVTNIEGDHRVKSVTISAVYADRRPVPGSEKVISCDTLMLSVGLVPENELSLQLGVQLSPVTGGAVVDNNLRTNIPGVFAAGNVLHVHDLVDFVSEESALAGRSAASYIKGQHPSGREVNIRCEGGIRYTIPTFITLGNPTDITFRFRVDDLYKQKRLAVYFDNTRVHWRKMQALAPGEMETLKLSAAIFSEHPELKDICIRLED